MGLLSLDISYRFSGGAACHGADSMSAARRTPLIAAIPKMFFPFLVILPGLIAIALPNSASQTPVAWASTSVAQPAESRGGAGIIPPKMDASTGLPKVDKDGNVVLDYDLAIPNMLLHYFPTGILGLGLTALLASFMSGMAGNVTAFNTVWTYDIYQSYIRPNASDAHYLMMGRLATVFGDRALVVAAYAATRFNNIVDMLQPHLRFCERALVCDFPTGDVLEARHRPTAHLWD
jgi:SSS family solute:Na+ symporter